MAQGRLRIFGYRRSPRRRPALAGVSLDAVPALLRDIDIASGCAVDYDGWLLGGVA